MHVLSSVDIERPLISFVCNSVSHFRPKHHLIASHVVIHHVFQGWHESFFVYQIKVNNFICSDLDSDVSFDVVDKSSDLDCVNKLPAFDVCHLIYCLFKKVNESRTSDYQTFTTEHYHLS